MYKNHFFLALLVVVFTFIGTAYSADSNDEFQEIWSEGFYVMGDGETPFVAEQRAFEIAKREAIEKTGVYIESYSKMKDWQITNDEINTIAAGYIETNIIEKKRFVEKNGTIKFYCCLKSRILAESVEQLKQKLDNKKIAVQYLELQEKQKIQLEEIERLKSQLLLTGNSTNEIDAIPKSKRELHNLELIFTENAVKMLEQEEYTPLIRYCNKMIKIDPTFCDAYYYRGCAHRNIVDYVNALKDFNFVISINRRYAVAYYERAQCELSLAQYEKAVFDFSEAIKLLPRNHNLFLGRGYAFFYQKQYVAAVNDWEVAVSLNHNSIDDLTDVPVSIKSMITVN